MLGTILPLPLCVLEIYKILLVSRLKLFINILSQDCIIMTSLKHNYDFKQQFFVSINRTYCHLLFCKFLAPYYR